MFRLCRSRVAAPLQDEGNIDTSGKGNDLPHLSNIRIDHDIADLEHIGLCDSISEQEHCLLWITPFRRPDQAMRIRPALMNSQCPLSSDVIVSGRRIDEVCPADAPFGEIRCEQGYQSKITLQLYEGVGKRLDIVDTNSFVRFVDRHIMKDRLVNRAFVIGREILRWDRIAAQE